MIDTPERSLVEPESVTNWPVCPRCGAETDTFFTDRYHEILGCPACLTRSDAWIWRENHGESL